MTDSPETIRRLVRLAELAVERDRIADDIQQAVIDARDHDGAGGRWCSWRQIAAMLRRTAPAVHRQFSPYVEPDGRYRPPQGPG